MSQKSNVVTEEKIQLNFLNETSNFLINFSLLGFFAFIFIAVINKPYFLLFFFFSFTSGIGIILKLSNKPKAISEEY